MSVFVEGNESLDNPGNGFDSLELKSCHCCGRTFNPKSLERHEKVCEKSNKTIRRTPFNSFLQRAKELTTVPVPPEQKEKEKKCREIHVPHPLKNGHSMHKVMINGVSPRKLPPSGYERCDSCDRFFSPKAAERHIAWCKEQKSRLPKTPPDAVALERLKARTKYKAPLPMKKYADPPNQRLIRSAESLRDSSSSLSSRESYHGSPTIMKKKSALSKSNNNIGEDYVHKSNGTECKPKKVKFKDIFPVDNREGDRNKNLDMLAALRLHLSELSASDDFLDDFVLRPGEDSLYETIRPVPTMQRSRFCYNCGTKYPVANAKFCCECGVQRLDPVF